MVDAWFLLVAVVAVASTVICVGAGTRRQVPGNATILSVLAVEAVLLVYAVSAVVRAAGGQGPTGPAWEFWSYLVTVLLIPLAVVIWALKERTPWSNVVLAVGGAVAFVMTARMNQIWYGIGTEAAVGPWLVS